MSIVLRILCMIIFHAAQSGDNTCKQCKYRVFLVILEIAGEILKSILIAQNFLHRNALYLLDKTFTLLFLFGMGKGFRQRKISRCNGDGSMGNWAIGSRGWGSGVWGKCEVHPIRGL